MEVSARGTSLCTRVRLSPCSFDALHTHLYPPTLPIIHRSIGLALCILIDPTQLDPFAETSSMHECPFAQKDTYLWGPTAPFPPHPNLHAPRVRVLPKPREPLPYISPERNLERMIWERWEEAARVMAKAGIGTWTGGKAGPTQEAGSQWRSGGCPCT